MPNLSWKRIVVLLAVLLVTGLPLMGSARYVIGVKGLSCPFCAYGLEKKLKKVENVESVEILMNKGQAVLRAKEGKDLDEDELYRAVKKAGFSVSFIRRVTGEEPDKTKGKRDQ